MRPQLHRPGDVLDHPVDLVLAQPVATVPCVCLVGGRDERLAEVTPWEHRNVLVENVPEVVDPSLAHRLQGLEALRVGDVVEHPNLVVGAEGRGPPLLCRGDDTHSDDQGSRKSANSVRPPSTKIVCPVM